MFGGSEIWPIFKHDLPVPAEIHLRKMGVNPPQLIILSWAIGRCSQQDPCDLGRLTVVAFRACQ